MRSEEEHVVYASSQDFRSQNLSDEELAQAIIDVKQLFQLRLHRQLDKPHQFKQ